MDRRRLLCARPSTLALLLALALLTSPWAPIGMARSSSRGASDVAVQSATLQTYLVAPEAVDPATVALQASHFVAFDPGATHQGQLLVLLGGFLANPADATLIVQQAATNGF